MKIAVIIGSLRHESFNARLAELVEGQMPEGVDCERVGISQLPYFNEDLEQDLPEAVVVFKDKLRRADGVLIITPEYNRSLPGAVKNAIDWASRPDSESVWVGKPVGIMGVSTGQFGTITAQFDAQRILQYCGARVMVRPQVLVGKVEKKLVDGQFDQATTKVVKKYIVALIEWMKGEQ